MSHVVLIQTEIRDPVAVFSACERLGLPEPVFGEVKLFLKTATGWAVKLPGWRFPVVCDVDTAEIAFDNYAGRWGKQKELDRFLQTYSVQKATIAARKNGHSVIEQSLEDGSIKLTVNVGGAV